MKTIFGISQLTAALAVLVLLSAPAQAQWDAGSKIRGDRGRYSGRPAQSTPRAVSPQRTYSAQPRVTAIQPQPSAAPQPPAAPQPAADPYEAFALQPLPFGVGDDVTVRGTAELMRGRRSLGSVPAGQPLRILRIRGPWVGVAAEIEGREVGGWLWYSQVAPADTAR